MTIVLDAGALIAIDRSDPTMMKLLAAASVHHEPLRTPSGVVAQVWRDGARQSRLSTWLRAVEEFPLDEARSRRVGTILRQARTSDVLDASVVELTRVGETVITSDRGDLAALANASGIRIRLVTI